MSYDVLVVGAGFAGSVAARELADAGRRVRLVDRRSHVGGNAFDELDEHGVLIHRYGPHIFHTNSERVVDYLSRFTEWRPYQHRVLSRTSRGLLPVPINRTTLERYFEIPLADDETAESFLDSLREPIENPANSEEVCLDRVGRELYEEFFEGYTSKQWNRHPRDLPPEVCARIPVRTDRDNRYFTDAYQQMPADGFSALFSRLLDHRGIDVALDADGAEEAAATATPVVWTGPVDSALDFRFGPLPWRSIEFAFRHYHERVVQAAPVINEPNVEVRYTRSTEFKRLTGQDHPGSTLCFEFACEGGPGVDPYYPIGTPEAREQYRRYVDAIEAERPNWLLAGRLARYQYLDMHQAVGNGLLVARNLIDLTV